MTIHELMDELAKYPPHLGVKVLLSNVMAGVPEGEPTPINLSVEDALDADVVRYEGTHILIESV